jgi:iron complex outermembrane recepter protein
MIRALKVSVGTIALMSGSAALAQSTKPAPEASEVADIVVTAQRVKSNLQNTPIAVTALSGETLTARGATSLLDVQNSTPNLTIGSRTTAGSARGGFTIRGIGVDASVGSAAVGIYVDEVYYPSAAANLLGLFDVDRIEVLRGPQGTLFGRNTIAGAVQYITTKPGKEFGGFITATAGNLDRLEVGGAINIPLSDTLSIRASGRYNRQGGYVYDVANKIDRGREETKQGRLQLRWQPTNKLTVDLKGEGLNLTGNGRAIAILGFNKTLPDPTNPFNGAAALLGPALAFGFNPAGLATIQPSARDYRFPGFNGRDSQDYDYYAGQANIAYDLSDTLTLKSISAYSHSRDENYVDFDGTPLSIIAIRRGLVTTKLFTQELQLSGKAFDNHLKFTLGAYYYRSEDIYEHIDQSFGFAPIVFPATGGDYKITTNAKALYGQFTYAFTDRFSASTGLRYSSEKATGALLNTLAPGVGVSAPVAPPAFGPYAKTFDDLSPSVGLNFQATPDALFYVKASKGFRAGGTAVNGNLVNPAAPLLPITTTPGYIPYGQETAWTYEGGARLQFLNRRIRFNPTIFLTDWKNIQFNSFVFNPNPQVVTRNAGDARIYGLELEAQAQVSEAFSLNSTVSYLHSEYTATRAGAPVTLASGLQRAPKVKFSLGGRYVIPLANDDRITLNADYAWTDKQRSATSDTDFINIPAYGLLNARIEYKLHNPAISLAVYGTNLTNQYYYIGGVNAFATFALVEADLLCVGGEAESGMALALRLPPFNRADVSARSRFCRPTECHWGRVRP